MNTAVLDAPSSYEQERGKPMPSENHGIVQANLTGEFLKHREYRVISELALLLNERPLTPDLSIYPRQQMDLRHDQIRRTDPPLTVVEIFSPTQSSQEILEKVEAYFNSGVKTCWVVNPPMHTITIYTADGSQKTYVEGEAIDPVTKLTANLDAVFS
jgi:Uma2 family endonuclease